MTTETNTTNNQNQQSSYSNFSKDADGNMTTPNSSGVLVLGILSIVFFWCYGLLSVVMAIVAIGLASAGERQYKLNPHLYSIASYKNLKSGKTCAIIGLCIAGFYILGIILWMVAFSTLFFDFLNLGFQN